MKISIAIRIITIASVMVGNFIAAKLLGVEGYGQLQSVILIANTALIFVLCGSLPYIRKNAKIANIENGNSIIGKTTVLNVTQFAIFFVVYSVLYKESDYLSPLMLLVATVILQVKREFLIAEGFSVKAEAIANLSRAIILIVVVIILNFNKSEISASFIYSCSLLIFSLLFIKFNVATKFNLRFSSLINIYGEVKYYAPNTIVYSAFKSAPLWVVTIFFGATELGTMQIAYQLILNINIVVAYLAQINGANISRYFSEDSYVKIERLRKKIKKYSLLLGMAGYLGGYLLLYVVVEYFLDSDFKNVLSYYKVLGVVVLANIINAGNSEILQMTGRVKITFYLNICSVFIYVIVMPFFVNTIDAVLLIYGLVRLFQALCLVWITKTEMKGWGNV